MKRKFLIISNRALNENESQLFRESISSNYVNIQAADNFFIILTDPDVKAVEVYEKIKSQYVHDTGFIVVEMGIWYGRLFSKAFEWLEEKFPTTKFRG